MVFVGNRRAKQRHNAVAQHLIDGALEAVHRVHHAVNGRIEELLRRFGIEAPDQLRRVLQVCKEYGNLLALAFQGGAVRIFRQVGWRVGQQGLGYTGAGGGGLRLTPCHPSRPGRCPSSTARRWASMSSSLSTATCSSFSPNWRRRVP